MWTLQGLTIMLIVGGNAGSGLCDTEKGRALAKGHKKAHPPHVQYWLVSLRIRLLKDHKAFRGSDEMITASAPLHRPKPLKICDVPVEGMRLTSRYCAWGTHGSMVEWLAGWLSEIGIGHI